MELKSNTKFTGSYSSGKDSTLAIYKAILMGFEPQSLIMTYNEDKNKTWFHGIDEKMIERLCDSLQIPIRLIRTSGKDYEMNFERVLKEERAKGAEVCVFGDIDIEEHLAWNTDRCNNADIKPLLPLWKKSREQVVYDFIDSGFITYITVIDTQKMDAKYIGKQLTRELVAELKSEGVDACGENGEYHTFVCDGPLFSKPVEFNPGIPVFDGRYVRIKVL
ncbi:Dph6-related ATP pyrophosphatase [Aminipila terrae]|uniref:Diphthine--ammonia ligase n=1 Tax=Aminipila terrae TaxID=2697030 RepID=A0A6P1MFZ2_9FIRM|nr:diphthine--ammonia ligase [Aminipila terrae]QHI73629.1 diphthine--ammonia ligase [Aminipila terrae]